MILFFPYKHRIENTFSVKIDRFSERQLDHSENRHLFQWYATCNFVDTYRKVRLCTADLLAEPVVWVLLLMFFFSASASRIFFSLLGRAFQQFPIRQMQVSTRMIITSERGERPRQPRPKTWLFKIGIKVEILTDNLAQTAIVCLNRTRYMYLMDKTLTKEH